MFTVGPCSPLSGFPARRLQLPGEQPSSATRSLCRLWPRAARARRHVRRVQAGAPAHRARVLHVLQLLQQQRAQPRGGRDLAAVRVPPEPRRRGRPKPRRLPPLHLPPLTEAGAQAQNQKPAGLQRPSVTLHPQPRRCCGPEPCPRASYLLFCFSSRLNDMNPCCGLGSRGTKPETNGLAGLL